MNLYKEGYNSLIFISVVAFLELIIAMLLINNYLMIFLFIIQFATLIFFYLKTQKIMNKFAEFQALVDQIKTIITELRDKTTKAPLTETEAEALLQQLNDIITEPIR